MHWSAYLLLFSVSICVYPSGFVSQTCNIVSHKALEHGSTRITTIQDGNYLIQTIVRLTGDSKCSQPYQAGLYSLFTMKYAFEKINNDSAILPWVKLGYQMDDSCVSLPITMARGIETVSLHRPKSVCKKEFQECGKTSGNPDATAKPITAVLGTRRSFTTIPLASLLGLYSIPQISPSASSRLLSKPEFKSFFRTIPSDTNQATAMLDIMSYFGWNYVYAIGSDDDYGKLGIAEVKDKAPARNVCIANDDYVPFNSGNNTMNKIRQIVTDIKSTPKAEVVILFCYAGDMGDMILTEAERQGVKRTWLTSEAWNPSALTMDAPGTQKQHVFTVSLKNEQPAHLNDEIRNMILRDFKCDFWLKLYIENNFNCSVDVIDGNMFNGTFNGNNCSIDKEEVVNSILYPSLGNMQNTIDAISVIAHGLHDLISAKCNDTTTCIPPTNIVPAELTDAVRKTTFVNTQGRQIAFSSTGDPKQARYLIENIQMVNGKLAYVSIGDWNMTRSPALKIQESKAVWPSGKPASVCSSVCQPGEKEIARTGCCWECEQCPPGTISNVTNSKTCYKCADDEHTEDGVKCVTTRILHLDMSNAEGISVIVMSIVGFVGTITAAAVVYILHDTIVIKESMPALTYFSFVLLAATFSYGIFHVVHPKESLCHVRFTYFFLLFCLFSGLLLVKTRVVTQVLIRYALKPCRGSLFFAQLSFLFGLLVIQTIAIVIWLLANPVDIAEYTPPRQYDIWLYCEPKFTASILLTAFLPCLLLLLATVYAFRERNLEQIYHEPKFLSFTCIALCLTALAFLPTYRYVVGYYKSIVLAFTVNLFAYIYFACLIIPKVYSSIVHAKDEIDAADAGVPIEMERQLSVPGMPQSHFLKKEEKEPVKSDGSSYRSVPENAIDINEISTSEVNTSDI